MWYADDSASDAFCCLGCHQLVPGESVVIGYDPERVVRVRCMLCGQVHTLRELAPDAITFWVGSSIEVLRHRTGGEVPSPHTRLLPTPGCHQPTHDWHETSVRAYDFSAVMDFAVPADA